MTDGFRAQLSSARVLVLDGDDAARVGRCLRCGEPTMQVTMEQDLETVPRYEPAWPGGPMVEVFTRLAPKKRPVPGSQRFTPECGHTTYLAGQEFFIERPA